MKHLKRLFLTTSLATILAFGSSTAVFAAEGSFITTNGTGIVSVQPDMAEVSFYVQTIGKTATAAKKENNKITAKVTSALEEVGILEDKIITGYSSVYPSYVYDDKTNERKISSYQARTNLEITIKDIDNVGKYIDVALKAGATGFNDATFSLENPTQYYGQALQAAVKNASASAVAIASAYGKPLGEIQSVIEHNSYDSYEESKNISRSLDAVSYGSSASETVIQYDKIQISANITATYQI